MNEVNKLKKTFFLPLPHCTTKCINSSFDTLAPSTSAEVAVPNSSSLYRFLLSVMNVKKEPCPSRSNDVSPSWISDVICPSMVARTFRSNVVALENHLFTVEVTVAV